MMILLEKYSPVSTMVLNTDTLCIRTFSDETIIAIPISPIMVPLY